MGTIVLTYKLSTATSMISNISTTSIDTDAVQRTVLEPGTGFLLPNEGSTCNISFKVVNTSPSSTLHNSDKQAVDILIGEADRIIDRIIDCYVCKMKKREKSLLKFALDKECNLVSSNPDLVSAKTDITELGLDHLELTITLHSLERSYEIWNVSCQEKLNKVLHHKTCGSSLFVSGNIPCAFRRFSKAGKFLLSLGSAADIDDTCLEQWKLLTCQVFLNLAACHTKSLDWPAVIWTCGRVLQVDSSNIKALYRRAVAYSSIMQYEEAIQDLLTAQSSKPDNTAIRNQLTKVTAAKQKYQSDLTLANQAQDSKLASAMSKMFE